MSTTLAIRKSILDLHVERIPIPRASPADHRVALLYGLRTSPHAESR